MLNILVTQANLPCCTITVYWVRKRVCRVTYVMGRYDNGGPILIYWYSSQLNDRGLGSDFLFLVTHGSRHAVATHLIKERKVLLNKMGPDGQPRLSLPRTPGSTVRQWYFLHRVYLCPCISLLFRGEVIWDSFPVEWSFGMSLSPYISIRGPETTGVISNRESLSWLQLLLYELIAITPIAHGEDVILQRAPPTTGLDPLYIPIPIPRYMHANLQARAAHCAVPMRYAWLAPYLQWPQTSRYKHKYLSKRTTDTSGTDKTFVTPF